MRVEKQKVVRTITKLEKLLQGISPNDSKHAVLSKKLDKARNDMRYIEFYPKDQKYISLYRETTDPAINEKRALIRAQIDAEEARKLREQRRMLHDSDSEVDFEGMCVMLRELVACYCILSFSKFLWRFAVSVQFTGFPLRSGYSLESKVMRENRGSCARATAYVAQQRFRRRF